MHGIYKSDDINQLLGFVNQHRIRTNVAVAKQTFETDLQHLYFFENVCLYDRLLSGSCAEFCIDPPSSCIGDVDTMLSLNAGVAFFEDRGIDIDMLRTNEQHFYPVTQIFRVRPVPQHPAYVTVDHVGDLKISKIDTWKYDICFDPENTRSRQMF